MSSRVNLFTAIQYIANADEYELAELDKNFNVLCGDLNKIAKEACNEIDQILSKSPEIE